MRDTETWMIFIAVVFSLLLVFRGKPSMSYIWYIWNIPLEREKKMLGRLMVVSIVAQVLDLKTPSGVKSSLPPNACLPLKILFNSCIPQFSSLQNGVLMIPKM